MFEITDKRLLNTRLVNLLEPNSSDAESYQRLRLSVEKLHMAGEGTVVAITSPAVGEGKTLTAINLAAALAQDKTHQVLLVELNLRETKNTLKSYLGIRKWTAPGLVENVSSHSVEWNQLACYLPAPNLHFMPAGQLSPAPYEILNSGRLSSIINEARRRYDFIILDTAAATLYPDAQLISRLADKFIILVAAGRTSKKQLESCLNLMSPDKVLGLVINACTQTRGEHHAF